MLFICEGDQMKSMKGRSIRKWKMWLLFIQGSWRVFLLKMCMWMNIIKVDHKKNKVCENRLESSGSE